jgi:hypothetical protein
MSADRGGTYVERGPLSVEAGAQAVRERIGLVTAIAVTSPIADQHKVEGIATALRQVDLDKGFPPYVTIRWGHNRNTGEVELFWGHYDLDETAALADFAERCRKDR